MTEWFSKFIDNIKHKETQGYLEKKNIVQESFLPPDNRIREKTIVIKAVKE